MIKAVELFLKQRPWYKDKQPQVRCTWEYNNGDDNKIHYYPIDDPDLIVKLINRKRGDLDQGLWVDGILRFKTQTGHLQVEVVA